MVKKTFIELQNQWDRVAHGTNWRGYIAQGNELELNFRKSGLSWTIGLQLFLSKFKIELYEKTMVEIGCGAGRMTEFLSQQVKELYAIDISSDLLAIARKRLNGINNIIYIGLVEENDELKMIENSSIDLVFSVAVFQHCSEIIVENYFKNIARILKPNGYFVFQIPIAQEHKTSLFNNEPAVDMTYWTQNEIEQLAKDNNYYIINIPIDTDSNGKEYFIFQKI